MIATDIPPMPLTNAADLSNLLLESLNDLGFVLTSVKPESKPLFEPDGTDGPDDGEACTDDLSDDHEETRWRESHMRQVLDVAYTAVSHVMADAYRAGRLTLASDANRTLRNLIDCRRLLDGMPSLSALEEV